MTLKNVIALLLLTACYSCSVNKAEIDNSLKKYFDAHKADGCFTMLKNTDGSIVVYNMNVDTQRFSPAGTFNIVNGLVGLQSGRITSEDMVIGWDGMQRTDKRWNKDMNVVEAYKTDNLSFFQEVAKRVGKDTMALWLDTLNYGNKKFTTSVDSMWLNNDLLISPDEQLGLLKKLFFDQLPFRKSVMQLVRDAMLKEDNTTYKLSYVSGKGSDKNGKQNAWLCGWIEENRHVYFFVTYLTIKDNSDVGTASLDITRDILKQYGFFEGKM